MINPSPDPVMPADAGRVAADFERAGDSTLIGLISRGSVPAFVELFNRTCEGARVELAAHFLETAWRREIFAASYVEVWWLAGCHRTPEVDATAWIAGIVRRRIEEAVRGMSRHGVRGASEGPRPSYAEREIAALLGRPVDDLLRA
ncbi:MAG TPA: hypothetical protein VFW27_26770 [Actinoplanes sp.]|jgi:hypothetical protein|nr:hypothetical protein [Actinoplanes sp.]